MRIKTIGVVAGLILAATSVPGISTAEDPQPPAEAQPQASAEQAPKPLRNGCQRLYTQRQFKRYARAVYVRKHVSKRAAIHMRSMVRCQHSPKAERKMRGVRKELRAARLARIRYARAVASLTPYPGPNGTHWAIPWYIVACESGGSWSAYNPSGAVGPYQLLGWGAPFPANSAAARLAHHRIAARVWNGGRGRSNWVC